MDNFFTSNKTSSNYSRTYSKGKSFKFSVWNSKDTYNNDEFVQDFVQWNQKLWAAKKTSTNIPPIQGDYWELIVDGVSDVEFKQEDNRILWKYEDDLEWKDLFELASVSEDQIRKMLEDLDIKYGNTYDVKLSETSTNAVQNQVVTKKFKELGDKNTKTDNELANIKSSVNTAISNSKSYTDLKISETKIQIDSELNKKANQTDVNEVVDVLNENINLKVDKVSGKRLSTNDFNDNYKSKLDNLNSSLNSTLTSAKSHTNSEITKVDNKINSEISRAKTSETNLSGRINDLEEDLVGALQEAKEYTDSLANGEVKNNTNKINILNGTGEGSVIKTVKDEISNIVGTAPEKLDTLQEIADYLEEHEDMASGLVNSLSELETKKADKTELNNLKTETNSALQSLEKSKANTTGYYPQMSVGFADDLVGRGESVPAEFSFRASGGKSIKDGTAWIKRLKGNSVVWNQLYSTDWGRTGDGITSNSLSNIITSNGTLTQTYFGVQPFVDNEANHKYLFIVEGLSSAFNDVSFELLNRYNARTIISNGFGYFIYVNSDPSQGRNIGFSRLTTGTVVNETYTIRQIDLTKAFPNDWQNINTIEDFYARIPMGVDLNAYNEGQVIHCNTESIKSVGDNAWDEEWELGSVNINTGSLTANSNAIRNANPIKVLPNQSYSVIAPSDLHVLFYDRNNNYLGWQNQADRNGFTTPVNASYIRFYCPSKTTYNHDICISLVHSGWKQDTDAGYQPYWEDRLIFDQRIKDEFPNGMQKWDMVYNKDGKGYIVHGLGVEDLGDLNWTMSSETYPRFHAKISGASLPPDVNSLANLLCVKYDNKSALQTYQGKVGISLDPQGYLRVYDPTYTDAASFKAAMAGVPLYYELAEPTIIEYDEPFNLDYKVADFGTEQAIAEQPSAPISADIIYQFNAVDMIREHELEIEELKTTIVNLQTLITQLQTSISSIE